MWARNRITRNPRQPLLFFAQRMHLVLVACCPWSPQQQLSMQNWSGYWVVLNAAGSSCGQVLLKWISREEDAGEGCAFTWRPQRLHLYNHPAAQRLCGTPSAGLNHVTLLNHYRTLLGWLISFYNCSTECRGNGALRRGSSKPSSVFSSVLLPLGIRAAALKDGPLNQTQLVWW